LRLGSINEPLKLLDDLMNRSVDPLFADHSLVRRKRSKSFKVVTSIITFLLCIAVGIAATSVVRTLHQDSRLNIRLELSKQLTQSNSQRKQLQGDISKLKNQISAGTKKLNAIPPLTQEQNDENLLNGASQVSGSGIVVDVKAGQDAGGTDQGRVTDGQQPREITDIDLQVLVQFLWANGAEAISVNSIRLGPLTTIRVAGTTVLIGLDGINPPYSIEAIGNITALENGMSAADAKEFIGNLKKVGISVSYAANNNITLNAVGESSLIYAKSGEEGNK
jgi:uncharacterized protein YlxW (UPF0749 family)